MANKLALFAMGVGVALAGASAQAVVIGFDNGETNDYLSFTQFTANNSDPADWNEGDWFGWAAWGSWPQASGIPDALADNSASNIGGLGVFPGDDEGIVDSSRSADDQFFGVVDTLNDLNPGATATATWTFDISDFENLSVSADFAAMGQFETLDDFIWTYAIDGGIAMDLFTDQPLPQVQQTYEMENGQSIVLPRPLSINGTLLNDVEQTISAAILGTGSILEINFLADTNEGGIVEAFLFDNLTVSGDPVTPTTDLPEPGTLGLVFAGLFGAFAARRLRQG